MIFLSGEGMDKSQIGWTKWATYSICKQYAILDGDQLVTKVMVILPLLVNGPRKFKSITAWNRAQCSAAEPVEFGYPICDFQHGLGCSPPVLFGVLLCLPG